MQTQRAPVILVGGLQAIIAFDAFTGQRLWQQAITFPPRLWTSGDLVVASSAGTIYCFRLRTGELVWKREGLHGADTLLEAHGVVMVAHNNGVTALATTDGRVLWQDASFRGQKLALAMEAGPSAQADNT
ncbi:MAG: PQQ-binding-like beta-propeller repeat protein [Sandaracinaceae bacterium]|nr:PQQ-binding-like beta-propeller repeat protein [Sandaracinaceae bacterium]